MKNTRITLPNYMEGSDERILPVCDVSGSMTGTPMDISISLGLYISERNKSVFKNVVCTFSEKPTLVTLKTGKLYDRVRELERIDWGMNTNLNLVFSQILDVAVKHGVPEKVMPTTVLIISDMEFDRCASFDDNAFQMIRRKYEEAGYKVPNVVFWNVKGRVGNSPVQVGQKGAALVSGYSPSILTSILSNVGDMSQEKVMLDTVMKERYDWNK